MYMCYMIRLHKRAWAIYLMRLKTFGGACSYFVRRTIEGDKDIVDKIQTFVVYDINI